MKQFILQEMMHDNAVLMEFIDTEQKIKKVEEAVLVMSGALAAGNKIISCGNGGSMCDAIHFASELSGRFKETREPLAAIALSDVGAMTCIANDFDYELIFSRQIKGLGKPGDVLLALSTSMHSKNVLSAIEQAEVQGMKIVIITGGHTGMAEFDGQTLIEIPSNNTARVQEMTIKIIHILVALIEKQLCTTQ